MHYARTGKRVMSPIPVQLFPRKALMLTATVQPLLECSKRHIAELRYHPRIAAYAVVVVMTSQFGHIQRPDITDAHHAAYLTQPAIHLFAGLAEFPGGRFTSQQKSTAPANSAIVCKAQKVKRIGLAALPVGVLSLVSTKTDCSGLFRVQAQAELRKTLAKHPLKFICALAVLYHADEIIGITHQMTLTVNDGPDAFVKPQIQNIV